jgi:hypothetical protein
MLQHVLVRISKDAQFMLPLARDSLKYRNRDLCLLARYCCKMCDLFILTRGEGKQMPRADTDGLA